MINDDLVVRWTSLCAVLTFLVLIGCAELKGPRMLAQQIGAYSALMSKEISNYNEKEINFLDARKSIIKELANSLSNAKSRFELERSAATLLRSYDYQRLEQSITSWLAKVDEARKASVAYSLPQGGKPSSDQGEVAVLMEYSKTMVELGEEDDVKERVKFFANYADAVVEDINSKEASFQKSEVVNKAVLDLGVFKHLSGEYSDNE